MERTSLSIPQHYVQFQSIDDSWHEGLLVLMYHAINAPPLLHGLRGLYVKPQFLAGQLRELKANNIQFTSLGDWNRGRSSSRQVALTFDDAYRNLFVNGLPVLQQLGVSAITYVVANHIGQSNVWDKEKSSRHERLMDRSEISEWLRCGNKIGSHGLSHCDLTTLSQEEARREIIDSKKQLEDAFGQPICHFCYPYGAWNQMIRDMVEEAGYETATTTITGFNAVDSDAFALNRLLARHRRPYLAAILP